MTDCHCENEKKNDKNEMLSTIKILLQWIWLSNQQNHKPRQTMLKKRDNWRKKLYNCVAFFSNKDQNSATNKVLGKLKLRFLVFPYNQLLRSHQNHIGQD